MSVKRNEAKRGGVEHFKTASQQNKADNDLSFLDSAFILLYPADEPPSTTLIYAQLVLPSN